MIDQIRVVSTCPYCKEDSSLVVDAEAFKRWQKGTPIQEAFPNLSADDRETLISGYHGSCFDEDFGGF